MANGSAGGVMGGTASLIDSVIGGVGALVGGTDTVQGASSGSSTQTVSAEQSVSGSEQLVLDPEAVQGIIRDVLGGADGIASIFAGEQNSGLYNSTVAAQAAGELSARLVAEIAKITGETVTSQDTTEERVTEEEFEQNTSQSSEDEGIIRDIGSMFGF